MIQKKVSIWLEDDPHAGTIVRVFPESVHVSASKGETVVWECVDGDAEILFKGPSPFRSSKFDAPRGGFVGTGLPLRGKVGEHYKYDVTVSRAGDHRKYQVDPEVVVDNGTAQ